VVTDPSGVAQSLLLQVSVVDEPSALGERAERPGFLDPRGEGRSCKVVGRGREPRKCRGSKGSWVPCRN
jgi:hypothetical protein